MLLKERIINKSSAILVLNIKFQDETKIFLHEINLKL